MESEQMHNMYMTVDQYNLFQSQLQWYNELCISQQNNYNQLCQLQLNQQKQCSICRVFKPYTEFYKGRCKDGFQSQCKKCQYNYKQSTEYKNKEKEYNQKYKSEHRDEINEHKRNRYNNDVNYRILDNMR